MAGSQKRSADTRTHPKTLEVSSFPSTMVWPQMPSRYSFTEYSPEWPDRFAREAADLKLILGQEFVCIHHIGSTAVQGLAAKPIIDLLPVVLNVNRIDALASKFEAAGYKAWGEYGIQGR